MKRSLASGTRSILPVLCYSVLLCLTATGVAEAQNEVVDCGSLKNAFGPFDYTDPANRSNERGESPLSLVERAHFTPQVERLVRGESSVNPVEDLAYTLRAFPNHHRALNAMANYQLRYKAKILAGFSIDCWFERAIRFKGNDPVVYLVYGVYLAKADRNEEALKQYKAALTLAPDSAEAHYNIGLLYADMKQYEEAYQHAVRAYQLGFPLPGLRQRLIRAGVWKQTTER